MSSYPPSDLRWRLFRDQNLVAEEVTAVAAELMTAKTTFRMTTVAITDLSGLSRSTVTHALAGSFMSRDTAKRLARVLGCTTEVDAIFACREPQYTLLDRDGLAWIIHVPTRLLGGEI